MRVLLINGSPRPKGCTYTALRHVADTLEQEGIESEIIHLGSAPIRDCVGCGACKQLENRCVFNDDVINDIIAKVEQADGVVLGSPVYFAHPTGRLLSALDRIFFAGSKAFIRKPGMAVVSARRAGTTATLDALNKHITYAQMPVVASSYWPMVHGSTPQEVLQDKEGLQTLEHGARNMAWLLKCIQAGQELGVEPPETKRVVKTNFIR